MDELGLSVIFQLPLNGNLSAGKPHKLVAGLAHSREIIILLKVGNHYLVDDAFGINIRDGAFKTITHLDGYTTASVAVFGLNQNQHAVVALLGSDAPFASQFDCIIVNGIALKVCHSDDGNLVGRSVVEGDQHAFQRICLLCCKYVGEVVDKTLVGRPCRNTGKSSDCCYGNHCNQGTEPADYTTSCHCLLRMKCRLKARLRHLPGKGNKPLASPLSWLFPLQDRQ